MILNRINSDHKTHMQYPCKFFILFHMDNNYNCLHSTSPLPKMQIDIVFLSSFQDATITSCNALGIV